MQVTDDARTSGATTPTLSIVGASPEDIGEYELVVTVGPSEVRSGRVIVGVRASSAGDADINGDGAINEADVLDLLDAVE